MGSRLTLDGRDDLAEAGVSAEVSWVRNSIAGQEFGSDWRVQYRVNGILLRYDFAPWGRRRR